MQKDVFFCLLNDLRVKFWFLCDFWWKMKSFWSFHCSVLDLGFDFCWFWSKVCSFMSFTWSFLVLGGEKNVFCKFFRFVLVESVCFGNWWKCLSWVAITWIKVSPRQYMGNHRRSVKLSGWVYRTSFVTHVLTRGHLSSCYDD